MHTVYILALFLSGAQALVPALPSVSQRRGKLILNSQVEDPEEAAIMKEAEQIAKKKRSKQFNEKGVAYAPWMVRQVDEQAIEVARELRSYRKRKQRLEQQQSEGFVNILDAASNELSGMGLKAKVDAGGAVSLFWGTESEDNVLGFVVEKKPVGPGDWIEVGGYRTFSELKSKGRLGGAYEFVDDNDDEDTGEFLYRVIAAQKDGSREITCQVGVTIESAGQQLQTKIIVGVAAALFAATLAAGLLLDPIKS
uniref:Uncharacterized protein n=1 Tax=Aureoumbra lagunensis TaxID=44058 RepID=A0A7S3K0Z6_9STRA|mmetsp:Transcript_3187/g.4422  ORF Transcript_3187/g.4422 Transcript_3187/m.4422 type:complete len:253 (-) Transcript_3187:396-1154(-)